MGKEIERKFLVCGDAWRKSTSVRYRQGYLSTDKDRTVRVRVAGENAYLTVKGITEGATRTEFEYSIPLEDAQIMLDTLCERPLIEKCRYTVDYHGRSWEVDEFLGDNAGLVVAEIELQSEDEALETPDWVAEEVTDDPRYFNANLVQHPFRQWDTEGPAQEWEAFVE